LSVYYTPISLGFVLMTFFEILIHTLLSSIRALRRIQVLGPAAEPASDPASIPREKRFPIGGMIATSDATRKTDGVGKDVSAPWTEH